MSAGPRPWIEIAAFVAVVVADAFGLVPLTQTILLLPLVWLALRLAGERWAAIGFSWPPLPWRAIGLGVVLGATLEAQAVLVTTPWISRAFGVEPDHSDLAAIEGDPALLGIFLVLSWSLAAFGEELCFRGFLMSRLAGLCGGGRAAWAAALVLSSALFGWGHTEQGIAGWVQEGLSGLLLGVLYLAAGRNLVLPIVAHGTANTIAFGLIYLGRYPGLG